MARIVMAVLVALAVAGATAQAPSQPMVPPNLPCVAQLASCAEFYSNASAVPTGECCTPLKRAYRDEVGCLCAVLTNPAFGALIGVDLKKGMGLFSRCGIEVPATVCRGSAPAAAPGGSPPMTPPKTGSGAVHGARWIGYSGVLGILLALWALLA